MHPKISYWKSEIENTTNEIVTIFGSLDNALLNTKPDINTWSVAQVMEHIMKVNETYYLVIRQVREGAYKIPAIGKIGFIHRFFGNMILQSVLPQTKRKTKTFPIWQPAESNIASGVVQRFEKHQKELADFMESCSDLLEKGTLISSPANKSIVYKLEKAFDIIVTHEERHLMQAKEIYERIKNR
jgi:hypothetical protein